MDGAFASPPNSGSRAELGRPRQKSHDAACDQCRLKKIRCNRQQPICLPCSRRNSRCSWGNKGRKTNQVTDGLQGIDNRLNTIETSLQSIMQFLQPSGMTASLRSNLQRETTASRLVVPHIPNTHDVNTAKTTSLSTPGALCINRSRDGSYYGDSSLQALINEIYGVIELRISCELPQDDIEVSESQWGRFIAQQEAARNELIDVLGSDTAPYIEEDNNLTLPPQKILEAVIEPYFLHIESEIPLLERTRCMAAIEESYGCTAETADPAWKVIFNYIMIQCFLGRYMPLERPSKDIDFLLTKEFELPFLASLWAAFSQLSLFLKPSFANVQALIALTVIAQRYFSVTAARSSLHLACVVAKAMGLHRHETHSHLTTAEIEERRRVFWALFTIDKELTFVLGLAPCLPSYDCDVPFPDAVSQYSIFRARFAQLTESIYMSLYSASAFRKESEQIEENIVRLEVELEELAKCDAMLSPSENGILQLESKYLYTLGKIMILRRSGDELKRNMSAQEARKCVGNLLSIRDSDTTIGGFMVLRRPFQWRPPMPFFEIIFSIFKEHDLAHQRENLLSAKAFVDTLRSVAWTDDAASYCGMLLQVTETCLEMSKVFVQACEASESGNSEDAMSIEDDDSEASYVSAESDE